MTTTDDRPPFEGIAEENAVLDHLRKLREARDAAHAALQDAIAEQRQAGMYYEVINTAVNPCPSWCDGRCETDPIDGSIGHRSALLQLAGPSAPEGEHPVAWLDAFVDHKPGEVLPEPTFSIHSDEQEYSLDAEGVRMFAAVLLLQLERITGSTDTTPRPEHLAAVMRLYRVPSSTTAGRWRASTDTRRRTRSTHG